MTAPFNSLGRLINRDEEGGFVADGAGFADGFDFPVNGRRFGKECGRPIRRNGKVHGNAAAVGRGEAAAVERNGIFVELVADDLLAAITSGA